MMRLRPALAWVDGTFRPGIAIQVEEGRIVAVESAGAPRPTDLELPGRAVLPGFVNAHSHAFQRLLRGRHQTRPSGATPSFWSWRRGMYALVGALTPDDVHAASRMVFLEMLLRGITAVGEFHYLHNDPEGRPYDEPGHLARRVVEAARSVGIRIALLNVCYAAGGIGKPLTSEQRRFATPDLERFLEETGALKEQLEGEAGTGLGIAPHSIRAVPRSWLAPLASWSRDEGVPLHVHASEQPGEVESALERLGLRPVELLDEEGILGAGTTLVHGIHLTEGEIDRVGRTRTTVCACPATERDLGDGIVPAAALLEAGGRLALGTDSHTVVDFLEEMRLLEYHERLTKLRRSILSPPDILLRAATEGGADSLGLEAGRIRRGMLADLAAVDLHHPFLAGVPTPDLAAALVLSAPPDVVTDVWVGGEHRVRGGHHPARDEVVAEYRETAARLLG